MNIYSPLELFVRTHATNSTLHRDTQTWWFRDAPDAVRQELAERGADMVRELVVMACTLPLAPEPHQTQAPRDDVDFRPASLPAESQEIVEINRAAFSWHPEQGDMTRSDFDAQVASSWFRADDLRVATSRDHATGNGLVGFCWTKFHDAPNSPTGVAAGEIYVIAVHPNFHGRNLGYRLTRMGLESLHSTYDVQSGFLYVEGTNDAALRTYARLGFTRLRCDLGVTLR